MAIMGNYKELLENFLKTELYVKRERLRPIQISGLPKGLEYEITHSNLGKVIAGYLDITGMILAYDVDEDNKSFKFWDKDGKVIGIKIKTEDENEKIGISEDGIEKIWSCHRNNLGDVKLSPVELVIQGDPISVSRKYERSKASIKAFDRRNSLSIKLENRSNKDAFYLLPYEDELIDYLMSPKTSLSGISLSEAYDCIQDITDLNLRKLDVSIKKSQYINSKDEVLSRILVNKGESPVISISLPAPNGERITYTISDTENGHVNITIETICGNRNTTVRKPIKTNLSIMEMYEFLIEIIKRGKIKTRD